MSPRKYLHISLTTWACIFLVLAGILISYIRYTKLPLELSSDYISYVETAKFFNHVPGAGFFPQRILKPLNPVFVALIQDILKSYSRAFFVQVYLLYAALIAVSFLFFQEYFKRLLPAVFCTALFAFGYPMMRYSLSGYTETGALLFYISTLYATLLFWRTSQKKYFILATFLAAVGFLWKEYTVVNLLILDLCVIFNKNFSKKQKFYFLIIAQVVFGIISGAWQLFVFQQYHYTFLDWFHKGGSFDKTQGSNYTLKNILKSLFAVFLAGWVFIIFSYQKIKSLVKSEQKFLLFSGLPPFLFLFWGSVSSRLFYVIAPVGVILVYFGTEYVFPSKKGRIISLFALLFVNLAWLLVAMHVV